MGTVIAWCFMVVAVAAIAVVYIFPLFGFLSAAIRAAGL